MEERMHVIGAGDNPILILKKREVPELFTAQFWYFFEMWQAFHNKISLGIDIQEGDPDLIKILSLLESHFEMHFSTRAAMLQYTEAIIRRMDAIIKRMDVYLGKRRRL